MPEKLRSVQRYRSFEEELKTLINKASLENDSNTPDFILASFLTNVLIEWNHAINARSHFTNRGSKDATKR